MKVYVAERRAGLRIFTLNNSNQRSSHGLSSRTPSEEIRDIRTCERQRVKSTQVKKLNLS